MQKTNKIPKRPRFDYVANKAYQLLLDMGFEEFPIDPWAIIHYYSENIHCISWREGREIFKVDDPFHLKRIGADARVILNDDPQNGKVYLIVYDDAAGYTPERIRWSIMHELGHIFLLHLIQFDQTRLDRTSGLMDDEYGVLEIEANFFAAEMFAPTDLFKYFEEVTVDELRLLCSISDKATEKRYSGLYDQTYHPSTPYAPKLRRNFISFINSTRTDEVLFNNSVELQNRFSIKNVEVLKCSECGSFTNSLSASRCAYCGREFDRNHSGNYFEMMRENNELIKVPPSHHVQFDTDNNGRLLYCPVCLNHEISSSDAYCSICGQPLINFCANENKDLEPQYFFCTDCGEPSSFYNAYVLAEERIRKLERVETPEDWLPYKYAYFIRWILGDKNNELRSLLFYTAWYVDDNDSIIIICLDETTATELTRKKTELLKIINENDNPIYSELEVRYLK